METQTIPSYCSCSLLKGQLWSLQTVNYLWEYSTRRKVLFLMLLMPTWIEQVLRVLLRLLTAQSMVLENWMTSRSAQVQGLPILVSFYLTGFCFLTFSPTPVNSPKPVRLPMNPAQPRLTKGWEPFSFRLQNAKTGYLFMGLLTSQSKARRWYKLPSRVAFPNAPKMEQPALVNQGSMLSQIRALTGIPEPSLIPAYSSSYLRGVQGLVMQQLAARTFFSSLMPSVRATPCSGLGNLAMNLNSYWAISKQQDQMSSIRLLIQFLSSDPQARPAWQEQPHTLTMQQFCASQLLQYWYFYPYWCVCTFEKLASMTGQGLEVP